jgi:hypothetical protein
MHPCKAAALGLYDECAANISIGPYADEPVGSIVAGLLMLLLLVANKLSLVIDLLAA